MGGPSHLVTVAVRVRMLRRVCLSVYTTSPVGRTAALPVMLDGVVVEDASGLREQEKRVSAMRLGYELLRRGTARFFSPQRSRPWPTI